MRRAQQVVASIDAQRRAKQARPLRQRRDHHQRAVAAAAHAQQRRLRVAALDERVGRRDEVVDRVLPAGGHPVAQRGQRDDAAAIEPDAARGVEVGRRAGNRQQHGVVAVQPCALAAQDVHGHRRAVARGRRFAHHLAVAEAGVRARGERRAPRPAAAHARPRRRLEVAGDLGDDVVAAHARQRRDAARCRQRHHRAALRAQVDRAQARRAAPAFGQVERAAGHGEALHLALLRHGDRGQLVPGDRLRRGQRQAQHLAARRVGDRADPDRVVVAELRLAHAVGPGRETAPAALAVRIGGPQVQRDIAAASVLHQREHVAAVARALEADAREARQSVGKLDAVLRRCGAQLVEDELHRTCRVGRRTSNAEEARAARAPRDVAAGVRRYGMWYLVGQQAARADVDDAHRDAIAAAVQQRERHLAAVRRRPEELDRQRAVRRRRVRVEHHALAGEVVDRLQRHQHRMLLRRRCLQREGEAAALDQGRVPARRRPHQRLQALAQRGAHGHGVEIAPAVGVLGGDPGERGAVVGVFQPREVVADGDAEAVLRLHARRGERIAARGRGGRRRRLGERGLGDARGAPARAGREAGDRCDGHGRDRPPRCKVVAHRRRQVHGRAFVGVEQAAMLGGAAASARRARIDRPSGRS